MKKNHLKNEGSIYLQQHSSNPINWFPWEKAKEKAKKRRKNNNSKYRIFKLSLVSCYGKRIISK